MLCYTSTGLQATQGLETGIQEAGVISKSNGISQSQGYNTGLSCSTILVYPALPYWPILLIAYFFHKVRARGIHQGSSATDSVTRRKEASLSEGPSLPVY